MPEGGESRLGCLPRESGAVMSEGKVEHELTRPSRCCAFVRVRRKVGQVLFHPTASNVLASASGDHVVRLWDITKTSAPAISLDAHGDSIQGLAWNLNGTLLATVSRPRQAFLSAWR